MDMLRALINQDSFRELENMSQRLNQVLAGRGGARGDREESIAVADWVPVVDILETDSEFQLLIELPGVDKDDVKLSIEAGVLSITGQRGQPKDEKGRRYHRVERAYGRFARSFSLPDTVDEQKLTAEFRNGILTVHLLKSEKAKPRSIEVKIS
jgi:HSP20 family protein